MTVKPFIDEQESVLEHTSTPFWTWVCTDERLIKYRSGSGTKEQFHDISFSEITAISYVNTGRKDNLLVYSIGASLIGLLFFYIGYDFGESLLYLLALSAIIAGGILFYLWWHSDDSYFEFRGGGLIRSEQSKWRVKGVSSEDTKETQNFINTVRRQLD